jgi:hypothetical protein
MPDRNQHVDRPTRPPYFWLSVSAVGVAVVILGVRVIALPASSMQPFAIAALVAVGVTGAIVAAYARAVTRRMRAAAISMTRRCGSTPRRPRRSRSTRSGCTSCARPSVRTGRSRHPPCGSAHSAAP